jgi:hypothetical protein
MAKSITIWIISDKSILTDPCNEAIAPMVAAGITDGIPTIIDGPTDTIPAGQYACERIWTTTAAAQNWLDNIDTVGSPAVALQKILVE